LQDGCSYENLKQALVDRFTDKLPDPYYYMQLQDAAHERGESGEEFGDICRKLRQRTIRGVQDIMFRVEKKTYRHEFLIAPLDVYYSGILGLDMLRRMEAKVDIRTSTLVLGRNRHRLAGQEIEQCALVCRHPRIVREALEMGLITPETTGPKAPVGTPIPGLSSGGSDIGGWDVVLPPLSQGIVVGNMRGRSNMDVPREVLMEPVRIETPGAYVA
jgi:hypothetical protein